MDQAFHLETDRLHLKAPAVADIPRITEFANNPKIADMTLTLPHPYQELDAVSWINMAREGREKGDLYVFAIHLKEIHAFIGGIGLHINPRFNHGELGYWLGEPFWGKGFMSEAAAAVIGFGFQEKNLHKVFARHFIGNPASGKIMIKNGMILEGEMKDHYKKGDTYLSLRQYRLTRAEWKAGHRT